MGPGTVVPVALHGTTHDPGNGALGGVPVHGSAGVQRDFNAVGVDGHARLVILGRPRLKAVLMNLLLRLAQLAAQPSVLHSLILGDGTARWDLKLTSWLLWCMAFGSPFWQEYSRALPQAEDMTCLVNYGPAEQPELQMLQLEAELQHSWACSMHEALFDLEKGELWNLGLNMSQADFVYALSLVRSRTFSEEVVAAKVHQIVNVLPVHKGGELSITYGMSKDNAILARDYGFVLPGNVQDRIPWQVVQATEQQKAVQAATSGPLGWAADALFKALGGRPADAPEPEAENLAAETAEETWAAARAALPKLYAGPLLAAAGFQGDMQNGSVTRLRPAGKSVAEGAAAVAQDPSLGRRLAAVLSMPVHNESSGLTAAATSMWPPRSITDSGRFNTRPASNPPLKSAFSSYEKEQQLEAAAKLHRQCAKLLQLWPTSMQQDEAVLQQQDLHIEQRHRQAVVMRHEFKQLVISGQEVLDLYAAHLRLS
eukprot:jgi/Astpho2/1011/Aster-00835